MTTPGINAPDGAYVIGARYGQDQNEEGIYRATTGKTRASFQNAQDKWKFGFDVEDERLDSIFDGQNALQGRLDLLQGTSGYATAFMSKSWDVPHSKWCVLPFDSQLGPVKGAGVVRPEPNSGWLALKSGGLWRVDAHVTIAGYTLNQQIIGTSTPPYFTVFTTYNPIAPTLLIEVFNGAGVLLTARHADALPNVAAYGASLFTVLNNPSTVAFNHTFVLDNFDAGGPNGSSEWIYVRVSLKYEPVDGVHFNTATCKAFGGTAWSGLTASRWSRDSTNNIVAPVVPDGGVLA